MLRWKSNYIPHNVTGCTYLSIPLSLWHYVCKRDPMAFMISRKIRANFINLSKFCTNTNTVPFSWEDYCDDFNEETPHAAPKYDFPGNCLKHNTTIPTPVHKVWYLNPCFPWNYWKHCTTVCQHLAKNFVPGSCNGLMMLTRTSHKNDITIKSQYDPTWYFMRWVISKKYEDFGTSSRYIGYAYIFTSHMKLGDVITNACPRYLLLAPKSTMYIEFVNTFLSAKAGCLFNIKYTYSFVVFSFVLAQVLCDWCYLFTHIPQDCFPQCQRNNPEVYGLNWPVSNPNNMTKHR